MLIAATSTGTRIGPLLVDASCAPQRVLGSLGWSLACGATLTNQSAADVLLQASLIDASGQAAGGQAQSATIPPAQSFTLPAPPQGQAWLVVAMTPGQAEGFGLAAVAVWLGISGAAGYGVYAAVRDFIHRHDARRGGGRR